MSIRETITRKCLDAIEESGMGVMTREGITESPDHTHFDIETEDGFFRIDISPIEKSND